MSSLDIILYLHKFGIRQKNMYVFFRRNCLRGNMRRVIIIKTIEYEMI